MPELPEVEILARHLAPAIKGRVIRSVDVRRARVTRPTEPRILQKRLAGARFLRLERRAKYLVFDLQLPGRQGRLQLIGHLGMSGRMYVQPVGQALPKHAAVVLELDRGRFVFEDTRYFGRFTLDTTPLAGLGPEPLGDVFTAGYLHGALGLSRQPVKVKLLDQSLVAGIGNIYASEALHRARISPLLPANELNFKQVQALRKSIREVLRDAIRRGSTLPLEFSAGGGKDGLFYFGKSKRAKASYEERLRVYDRSGQPCGECARPIRQIVQAGRSTFFCEHCQHHPEPRKNFARRRNATMIQR